MSNEHPLNDACLVWLDEQGKESPSCKRQLLILSLMMQTDLAVRTEIEKHAEKWLAEALSEDGIRNLVDHGWAAEIPLIARLQAQAEHSELVIMTKAEVEELARGAAV